MDHLRPGIGLVGYAQDDPKTEYKREGMKEFDAMWDGVQDKVTDIGLPHGGRAKASRNRSGRSARRCTRPRRRSRSHAEHPRPAAAAITNSQQSDKKPEPIRNRGEKVGRNDPCPCGSGKKYKNCHMRHGGEVVFGSPHSPGEPGA